MKIYAISASAMFVLSVALTAQSTSPLQRISDSSAGNITAPTPGSGYISVFLREATVYQQSGWYTNFIENHRQAVITVTLSGTVANIPVTQTVVGKPVELHKNNSMVDLGYAGAVVDHLPTTFSGLNMSINVNKTSQDGLQGLLTQVSQLSTGQPPIISMSQQALGIASLSKSFADFLFKSNLLVQKAQIQVPLPTSGLPQPGIYVVFASDSNSEYQQYLGNAPSTLKWSGAQLTFNGSPIQKVSYFIIEISYSKRFFANPLDSLSFGATDPWVSLYLLASREIPTINDAAQAVTDLNDIESHLTDARTLLDADPQFIQDEKDSIADAVYKKINDSYHQRCAQLQLSACDGSHTTNVAAATSNTPVNGPDAQPTASAVTQPIPKPIPRINLKVDPLGLSEEHSHIIEEVEHDAHPVRSTAKF